MDEVDRKAIELVRSELVIGETRLYDHLSRTFQWLMATLFAANGGAIVALFGKEADRPGMRWALASFALGVILSLLMGASTSFVSLRAGLQMGQMRLKLEAALITGEAPIEDMQKYVDSQKLGWRTWIPSYIGGASLLFFVIGMTAVAISLSNLARTTL